MSKSRLVDVRVTWWEAQVDSFDFIIIGAGTAGCVVANRLSENPNLSILLIEAGGSDSHPILKLPILAGAAYTYKPTNWNYTSEIEEHLDSRKIPWPRGKVLGGTSSINGMMHIRGNPGDFDNWALSGSKGWSYKDVLPYFLKAEGNIYRDGPYHNSNGPFKVSRANSKNQLYERFLNACELSGYSKNDDLNGKIQEGVGRQDFNILNGRRVSSATSYLHPIKKRKNLKVQTKMLVSRIIFDGSTAIGVECQDSKNNSNSIKFFASKEVIVSAGTINSPQILQLSGIGDANHLKKLGISIVNHSPKVGENLQDHLGAYVQVECTKNISLYNLFRKDRLIFALMRALVFKDGPATSIPLEAGGFIKSDPSISLPDFQITFCPGLSLETTLKGQGQHGYLMHYYVARPKSRGSVKITSSDPQVAPAIKPNSLSNSDDMRLMKVGLNIARKILSQVPFDDVRGKEISPGSQIYDDIEIENWIRRNATTVWHPTSTCKMGSELDAVVNSELKVLGVKKLRVVDASIMPSITTGNTATPAIMIAEKASDMIRKDYNL